MEIYFKQAWPKKQRKQSSQGDQRTDPWCQVTVFLRSLLRSHHLLEQGGRTKSSSTGNPTCWQWENIIWHNIYIYVVNIGIILYIIISIHTIYMYKDVYSMIYHNIHDKKMARYHQHIVDISLPRCDHKSWSLPASSSSGTTVWEKHASLQNTQIDISYMLLHHANIFVWFSTHGNTPLSTLGQPCFRFWPGAMSDDSPQINHHWHHWEGGKLEIPWSNIHCRFRMTHILLNIIELQFNVSQSFIEVKVPLTASKTVNGNHHMQLAFRACWLLEPTVMVTLECHTWLTWNIFDSLIHVWTAALICPHRSETLESVEPVATYDYLTTSSHQPPNAALVVMPRHWKMI